MQTFQKIDPLVMTSVLWMAPIMKLSLKLPFININMVCSSLHPANHILFNIIKYVKMEF